MKPPVLFLVLAACVGLAGCSNENPVEPSASEVPRLAKVAGPAQVEGEIGPGALYGLYIPADWNGDLVLYAHGYVRPDAPIALPGGFFLDALRDGLLGLGYGVAWSSYAENGYAIKDGVIRTRQLRGLFTSTFGNPDRTYVMGHSLGGIITLMAAEKNPGLFDGALPMCGLVGGGAMQADYLYDTRILFDYFYPGVLPGDALNVPTGVDFGADIVPLVVAAVSANPGPAFEMAGVDQIELPYTNPGQLINSILSVLFFNFVATEDLFDRTNRSFYDNTTKVYSGSLDDAALNAGVDRFSGTPEARNYLDHYYEPNGDLKLPVMTLHTTMDPVVPLFHEPAYAAIVAAAGKSDLLVQRVVDRYGHCFFSPQEQLGAFLDLVNWAENGVTPVP